MRIVKTFLVIVVLGLLLTESVLQIQSASCEDSCDDKSGAEKLTCLNEVKQACEAKLEETSSKRRTLQSTIDYLNSQIAFTQSQINETVFQIEALEEEIEQLLEKISILNISLEETTQVLLRRIVATYKQSKIHPFALFFSSHGFSDFVNKFTYLRTLQENDREVMFDLEQSRANFDMQKTVKEEKQEEVLELQTQLVAQKSTLAGQKASKSNLLEQTKSDEKRYQQLLARARAEFEAIQNVLAGAGDETEIGDVGEGTLIARIIPTASCNSNGPHLHFTITQGDSVQNPFQHLRSIDHENYSGSSLGSSDGDDFNPGGDWTWPIDATVKLNQGFGETWAIKNTWVGGIYSFHNGIDVYHDSLNVKAVKNGKLFRGSYVGSGGCTLRYVKVDHNDSDINSYYLHVNYI